MYFARLKFHKSVKNKVWTIINYFVSVYIFWNTKFAKFITLKIYPLYGTLPLLELQFTLQEPCEPQVLAGAREVGLMLQYSKRCKDIWYIVIKTLPQVQALHCFLCFKIMIYGIHQWCSPTHTELVEKTLFSEFNAKPRLQSTNKDICKPPVAQANKAFFFTTW